jgi:hypothetical protein
VSQFTLVETWDWGVGFVSAEILYGSARWPSRCEWIVPGTLAL